MGYEPQRQSEWEPEPESGASGEVSDAGEVAGANALRSSSDLIGQTLAGRYRFDALLGEGTFARVFRVYDLHRRAVLAAKVLRSDIAHEPMFLERFRREARVLERLQHPHIMRYYDIVESGDVVFIVTDYIAGRTLQSVLRAAGGPLDPAESLAYVTPLAAALHFAHQEGVIHRDLKPSNILIDANQNLYVTDFGIARILSDTSTLTVDATVGTPHYMAPEQIMSGQVGPATDIYALGVMLYQMYTGRLPFVGDRPGATGTTAALRIVYEHLHVQPIPPTSINPRLSRAVEAVILRCLEKDPARRYPSVSALYDALTEAIDTPATPLEAAAISSVVSEAEPVPTGVGGASRIAPAAESDRARRQPRRDLADEEAAETGDEDYDHLAWGEDWRRYYKRKREEQRVARKAKRGAREREAMGEKEREKEDEKQRDSEEKNEEKTREKGRETHVEKGEFWGDFSPSDRLSQFTWGGIVLWAGIVFLLSDYGGADAFKDQWPWIFGGAGALLLTEVMARLVLPEYRAKPGLRLVLGVVLMTLGLGMGFGFASLWPLILIAIGASLFLNQLLD